MGSSKKQTVGYRYYMGLHFGLCHGPVDDFTQFKAGDREAWSGSVADNDTISVDAPELFGGEKKEGGLSGAVDILMGAPSQGLNGYLVGQLGAIIPAFRGILSVVWRGGLIAANNPYVKPFSFRVTRILKGWKGGTPWYPAKAKPLAAATDSEFTVVDDCSSLAEYVASGTNNSIFTDGNVFYSNPASVAGFQNYVRPIPANNFLFARVRFRVMNPGSGDSMRFYVTNGAGQIIVGIEPRIESNTDATNKMRVNSQPVGTAAIPIGVWHRVECTRTPANLIDFVVINEETEAVFGSGTVASVVDMVGANIAFTFTIEATPTGTQMDDVFVQQGVISNLAGMNPAHIIYECLTNDDWGMGYPTSTIDDASFTAAADQLYSEAFGLSMIWNRQETIEQFVQVVVKHIGASLYVRPDTGKFALKLVRNDYEPSALPLFNPSNIVSINDYQRQTWGETVNEITVIYRDWLTNKDAAVTVQDLANIQTQGAVVPQSRQYPGVSNAELAQRLALRDLTSVSTPLATVQFTAKREAWDTIPAGVFRLTWPDLGISDVVFRVLEVNGGTLQNGLITIKAAEDVFGLPTTTYVAEQPGGWVDPSSDPAPSPAQLVLEAPYWDLARGLSAADLDYLDDLSGFLETLAVRPSGDALNYEINARVGAAEFEERAIGEFCPAATLSIDLARTTTAITFTGGVDLDLVTVGGYALIGAEVVGVTALDPIAGTATITRGLLDTVPALHSAGAVLFFADGFQGADPTEYAVGEDVDAKLLPRTGRGELALADAATASITMAQRHNRPYPPGLFRINSLVYPAELVEVALSASWAHRDRLAQTAYLVEQDEASIGPEAGVTYTARLYDNDTTALLDEQTGIAGTTWAGPSLSGVFTLRLEVAAVRGGLESWQPQTHVFAYINGARVTEGGDNRETEAGEIRSQE